MNRELKERVLLIAVLLWVAIACNLSRALPQPVATQPANPQPALSQTPPSQELAEPTATLYSVFMPSISAGGASGASSEGEPTIIPPDPHIEILASQETLKVGDTVTVTGKPVEIGLPIYELNVRDEGVQNAPSLVRVTYENQLTPLNGTSQVLEYVSAEGGMDQVTFVLRAKAPGIATISINATGEIHSGSTGPATFYGGASGSVVIKVTE